MYEFKNNKTMIRRQLPLRKPLLTLAETWPDLGLTSSSRRSLFPKRISLYAATREEPGLVHRRSRQGWTPTIGLELHVQLKSPIKLFSHAPTSFDAVPNEHVAFFDAALPGALPVRERKATLLPAEFNSKYITGRY